MVGCLEVSITLFWRSLFLPIQIDTSHCFLLGFSGTQIKSPFCFHLSAMLVSPRAATSLRTQHTGHILCRQLRYSDVPLPPPSVICLLCSLSIAGSGPGIRHLLLHLTSRRFPRPEPFVALSPRECQMTNCFNSLFRG